MKTSTSARQLGALKREIRKEAIAIKTKQIPVRLMGLMTGAGSTVESLVKAGVSVYVAPGVLATGTPPMTNFLPPLCYNELHTSCHQLCFGRSKTIWLAHDAQQIARWLTDEIADDILGELELKYPQYSPITYPEEPVSEDAAMQRKRVLPNRLKEIASTYGFDVNWYSSRTILSTSDNLERVIPMSLQPSSLAALLRGDSTVQLTTVMAISIAYDISVDYFLTQNYINDYTSVFYRDEDNTPIELAGSRRRILQYYLRLPEEDACRLFSDVFLKTQEAGAETEKELPE